MKLFLTIILFFLIPQNQFAQSSTNTDDEIVYITNSGSKYHAAGCSYLKSSAIAKKLSEVKDSYSRCSRCIGKSSNSSSSSLKQNFLKNSSSSSPSMGTPSGTTKSGAAIYTGPRGGKYHFSKSGKKVYEKKKK